MKRIIAFLGTGKVFLSGTDWLWGLAILPLLLTAGCAGTSGRLAHFAPAPREEIGAVELEPVTPKVVADMLRQAEQELCKANEAHEKGEKDQAGQHYRKMLEIILDADLDADLYYANREQFDALLGSYMRHAHLYHADRRIGASHSGVYSDLVIPMPLPQPVLTEIEELKNSYSGTFQRGLNRSSRYLPYLQEEFRKAGLPEDLAWLAMVESMYQAKVVSPAGAGGMWQFMRTTGRRYNLRMDSYVDERYNWHSSTRAAIEYLKTLHDFFDGDWALAVTAYNMGEGGLDRAINANGGNRDFWTLINTPPASDRIKQESKKYYPRLLAYIIVANAPQEYGFTCEPEPFEDVLRIPVQGSYSLAALDEALGLSRGTLARLNPDLLRESTPPQGEYAVAVPREHQEPFLAALKTVKSVQTAGTHRVRRGETLAQIARHYGVCEKELMRANRIRSARSLQVNQVLHLPDSAENRGGPETEAPQEASASASNAPQKAGSPSVVAKAQSAPAAKTAPVEYVVKKGDTLFDIAKAHKINMAELQQWNEIKRNSVIKVGQKLIVGRKPVVSREPVQYHEVKPGEYPGIIAQLYGVSVRDLLRWNNLTEQSVIRTGDKLLVAGSKTVPPSLAEEKTSGQEATASPPAKVRHKVAPGENAGVIAARYGVSLRNLLAWNNLTSKSILRVGQELEIRNPAKSEAARSPKSDIQIAQASEESTKVVHKVTAGQNPTSIAKQYGVNVQDLFKWNNWNDRHVLRVGDTVSIYRD